MDNVSFLRENNQKKYKEEKKRITDEVIEILEKKFGNIKSHADGGMEIFLKSEVMKRFVTKKDDMFTLDFSENDHLPKQVMYYVYSLYQDFQKEER